jgi:hypothetical protein
MKIDAVTAHAYCAGGTRARVRDIRGNCACIRTTRYRRARRVERLEMWAGRPPSPSPLSG